AHAAEQVDLEVAEADADRVRVRRQRRATATAHSRFRGDCADRREALRTLDPVLRTRTLDIQHADAKIAVVRERLFDQLLQHRIDEELAPCERGHCAPCCGRRAAGVGRYASRSADSATG